LSNFGNNVRNKFYDIGTGIGNFADRFGNSGRARREGRAAKQDRFKQLREARTERDAALEARRSQHRDYGVVGRGISAFARGLGNIWNEGKKAYNDMIYPELPEAMQNTSDVIGGAADLGMHGIKIGAMGLGALARGARKFGNWASDKYQAYKYGRDARNSARERFENERQDWLRNREANRATNPIFQRVQHSARPVVPELPEAYRTGRSTLQKALIDEAIERNRAANPPAPAEVAEAEPQQPSSLRTIANTVGNAALQTAKLPLNAIGAVGRGLYNHFLGDQPEAPAEAPAAPPPTPPVEHELGALDRSRPIEERPVRPPSAIPASEKRFSHSAESNAPRDYSNVYDDRNLRDAFADFDLKF
jgi:hypothetical protein